MILNIEKLNHQGEGISHYNDKIVFVPNALKGEKVETEIIFENSKYMVAKVLEYKEKSKVRVKSKCPFFDICGGCDLRNMSYQDTIEFKKEKVKEILLKYANLSPKIQVVKSSQNAYRNKLTIHIVNGKAGLYKKRSKKIVQVDRCLSVEPAINNILLKINLLHVTNGEVVIKSNYNSEILLVITSDEEPNIEINKLTESVKLVGIVWNGKTIYGTSYFIEIVDDMLFRESAFSFFQTNRNVTKEIFSLINEKIKPNTVVADLCCGVGTLSILASYKAKRVYGIELNKSSIRDALINAKMNKRENVNFMLGDAFKLLDNIEDNIDMVIVDPPRNGLSKIGVQNVLKKKPNQIIYVSCNPITLARDLNSFKENYELTETIILDMFPNTHHVETVVFMKNREINTEVN